MGSATRRFVLARPGSGPRAKAAAAAASATRSGISPGVTEASAHDIPVAEYEQWAEANGLELILFDENYQWEAVAIFFAAGAWLSYVLLSCSHTSGPATPGTACSGSRGRRYGGC